MNYLVTSTFWDLPACSKLDVLTEKQHGHIIVAALRDSETHIEFVDRGCVLYGKEEGLLIDNPSLVLFLVLSLFMVFLKILHSSSNTR